MPNFKSVVHFLLVDCGGGSCCDRGKTKSTPSLTKLRLEFDKIIGCRIGLYTEFRTLKPSNLAVRY